MGVKLKEFGGGKIECVRPVSGFCLVHLGSDEIFMGPGSCCDERPSHPQDIMGIPKYWMEDWRSRWDELRRCGVRQWKWDVPGTPSARK